MSISEVKNHTFNIVKSSKFAINANTKRTYRPLDSKNGINTYKLSNTGGTTVNRKQTV